MATSPSHAAPAPPAHATGTLRSALRVARQLLHAILGVPDYERYVAHLHANYPGCPIPSRHEFERERLKARYERPGSRCC